MTSIKLFEIKKSLDISDDSFVSRITDNERYKSTSVAFNDLVNKENRVKTIIGTKEAYDTIKLFLDTQRYDYDLGVLNGIFGVESEAPVIEKKEEEVVETEFVTERDFNLAQVCFVLFSIFFAFSFTVPIVYSAIEASEFYDSKPLIMAILSYSLAILTDLSAYFMLRYGHKKLIYVVLCDMIVLSLASFKLFGTLSDTVSYIAFTISLILSFYSLFLAVEKK